MASNMPRWLRSLGARFTRFERGTSSDYRSLFEASEWKTLQIAPFWLLIGIGFADGKLDDREEEAFFEYLNAALTFPDGLAREVLLSIATNVRSAMYAVDDDMASRTPEQTLRDAAALVDQRAPRDEAVIYKLALLDLGAAVALASSRFLGPKVSRSEKRELARVQSWLNLDTPRARKVAKRYRKRRAPTESDRIAESRAKAMREGRYFLFDPDTPAEAIAQHIVDVQATLATPADDDQEIPPGTPTPGSQGPDPRR